MPEKNYVSYRRMGRYHNKIIDYINSLFLPIGTVISGLSGIALSGKLSDAVEDSEHRTVTDAEKDLWNAGNNFSISLNAEGKPILTITTEE